MKKIRLLFDKLKNESEENKRVKLMLDTSPLSCFMIDENNKCLDCNAKVLELFEVKDKQEFFDNMMNFVPEYQPDGRPSVEITKYLREKAFKEGKSELEWTLQLLDGTPLPVSMTLMRVNYCGKDVLLLYTTDMREKNKMSKEIEQRVNELTLQRNTLQTLIDSMPDFVFSKDINSNYTLLNRAIVDFFNLDMDDVLGKGDLDGFKFPEEVARIMINADKETIKGAKKVITEDIITSFEGVTKNIETTKAPLIQNGVVVGLVGVARDITEKKRMAKNLEAALAQAESASKAKGDFLSNMSHEMRTPLNAIIGMTTIGKRAKTIDEKNQALIKINDASSHLLGVINDVLDMAKIEAKKFDLAPTEYNFELMLQKVTTVVTFRVDEKEQNLTVHIDHRIPRYVVGDDQRLAQVVTNLLSNAVKFTPEGGKIRLEAILTNETDGECEIRFEVADSGIGISAEQQEKLFRAFEQAESGISRQYGGTGLGLVISKRIVELMGGDIKVESELGKGSKFSFSVKVRRGSKSPNSLLAPGVNWKNVRILAVDDMEEAREQLKNLFDLHGISCDVACDGSEAFNMIEENGEYDIYFIDWLMPVMNGIELTKRIKSRKDGRPSVVIMITAADWEQVKDDAAEAGVDRYLLKPLFPSMVIDCLNEYLGDTSVNEGEPTGKEGEFAGKRLLLAEDIDINREILTALLSDSGLNIDCAENGKEALEMIEANPNRYDIVLMDVQMPKMDGLEATRSIRALPNAGTPSRRRLPIVAMTANVFKSDVEDCLKSGMDGHIGKPVDIDKLMEALRKYLLK